VGGGKNVLVSTSGLSIFGIGISDGKLKQKDFLHSVEEKVRTEKRIYRIF